MYVRLFDRVVSARFGYVLLLDTYIDNLLSIVEAQLHGFCPNQLDSMEATP
jgi:hypothetical protein